MKHAVKLSQSPAPRISTLAPSASGLLQRKCACAESSNASGECEGSAAEHLQRRTQDSDAETPTAPIGRFNHDFASVRIHATAPDQVQGKLTVSQPSDKYELEADQMAESVMRKLDDPAHEEAVGEDIDAQSAEQISPLIQRQTDPMEEEAETAESEEDITLQPKSFDDGRPPTAPDTGASVSTTMDVSAELSRAKAGGAALPEGLRSSMERAFGADFSQVRVHHDSGSHALSHSIHAAAFTTSMHIFFRDGGYEPASAHGRRLLAHELTHVLQQNPHLKLSTPAAHLRAAPTLKGQPLQRQLSPVTSDTPLILRDAVSGDGPSRVEIGVLFFFDAKGDLIYQATVLSDVANIPERVYSAKLSGQADSLEIRFGANRLPITSVSDPAEFAAARSKAAMLKLLITDEQRIGTGPKFSEKDTDSKKPPGATIGQSDGTPPAGVKPDAPTADTGDVTDVDGVPGGQGTAGGTKSTGPKGTGPTGTGPTGDPANTPPTPGGDPGGQQTDTPGPDVPQGPQSKGKAKQSGTPDKKDPSKDLAEDKTDESENQQEATDAGGAGGTGTGTGTGPGTGSHTDKSGTTPNNNKTGSRYGGLGLLGDLIPQSVINAIDGVLDLMDDSDEWQTLAALFNNLKEFQTYAGELEAWLEDPDKFLDVVLGLENNDNINKLESWANSEPKQSKAKSAGKKAGGLMAIVRKLKNIIDSIRRILKPIFKTRRIFVTAFEGITLILEEMPVIQELLGEGADSGDAARAALLEKLSSDFSGALHKKMIAARVAFKGNIQILEESALIKYEDLARAIMDFTKKALPVEAKPFVWIAEKLGLDDAISDDVVAPLIPKELLEAINDVLRKIFKVVEPVINEADEAIGAVLAGVEKALNDYLEPEIKKIFAQPADGSPRNRFSSSSQISVLESMRTSRGAALNSGVRIDMESRFGFDFGSVRIHTDQDAQRASEMVGANAFTVGHDLFFGAGRFNPDSFAGQKLLAHELTHVLQQSDGQQMGVIQRDASSILKKLVEKYGERVRSTLSASFQASPKKKAEAASMQKAAEKIIGEPVSKVKLPDAYSFVRVNKKIVGVRRKVAWMRLVYPLTVINNKIQYGFERREDPVAAAARKELRRNLGCTDKQQAHHVIPLEFRNDPLVRLAEKVGHFNFNGRENGECLSKEIHTGSHPEYSAEVAGNLAGVREQAEEKAVWDKVKPLFDAYLEAQKDDLKRRRKKLQ